MLKGYIAGPMTGKVDYNFPAFYAMADELTEAGFSPINPARRGLIDGYRWEDYLRDCLPDVAEADFMVMLVGWEKSRGASVEFYLANVLGMEIVYQNGAYVP